MKKGYRLIDGVERHRECPATFRIPSNREKAAIKKGHLVKIGVENPDQSLFWERFWVMVLERDGDQFKGQIDNSLVVDFGWHYGDTVKFRERHILAVYTD